MNKFNVIIIGSGLGGLLCGYILSKEGYSVCILEKQPKAGGNLQTFMRSGCAFDTGVHYIGSLLPGQTLHTYWKYFGLTDKLSLRRMDTKGFDQISILDHDYYLAQGFDQFISRLLEKFPKEERSLSDYINQLQVISRSFPLYNLENLAAGSKDPYITAGAFRFFTSVTTDPMLSSVLAGNNFLFAGHPDKTPLHVAALINHSFISSAWRLVGGSRQIADILVKEIRSMGGEIYTSCSAEDISREKELFFVKPSKGELLQSEILISNIHPGVTLGMLDPSLVKESFRLRVVNLQNTISSFILNLVLKPGSFPYLNHNVYYYDSPNVWTSETSRGSRWPENYLLYTPAHSADDEFARSVIILTYMDYSEVREWENSAVGERGKKYEAFKHNRSDRLMKLVSARFPSLPQSVVSMEASTPLTYRDYTGTPEGSMYGVQKDFNDPLKTMLVPRTKIRNLFFTGQNVGLHGMLGVTIGAIQTCGDILGLDYLMTKIREH
ncbi:MAG: NAD(P)-binding protein [bacterium]